MENFIQQEAMVVIKDGSQATIKVGDLIKDDHTNEYHEVEFIHSVYDMNFEQVILFICKFESDFQRAVRPECIIAIEKK